MALSVGYGLDDSGFKTRQGQQMFYPLKNVQTDSGAQTASYSMGIGRCFARVKAAGAYGWPLTLISR
jgi:hypothetical protein